MLFYSLASGKIVKSDRWKQLPITPEVVSVINAISKEAASRDPIFSFHGNVIGDNDVVDSPQLEMVECQFKQYEAIMNLSPLEDALPQPSPPLLESSPPNTIDTLLHPLPSAVSISNPNEVSPNRFCQLSKGSLEEFEKNLLISQITRCITSASKKEFVTLLTL